MARILRGDVVWADLRDHLGRLSPEEIQSVVEGLNEIIGD